MDEMEGAMSKDDQHDAAKGDQRAVSSTPWTRRTLLKAGGVAAASLLLPEQALGRTVRPRFTLSHPMRRSSYNGLTGQRFWIQGSAPLRLESVEDLNALQAGSESAFALVFSGPPTLADPVPMLYHRWLGSFQMLLSPGSATANGGTYVAIINDLESARSALVRRPAHKQIHRPRLHELEPQA
jgi:hypothetical protein